MRKNGSRLISLRQYRITDLLIFAAILVVFDLLAHFAPMLFPAGAMFFLTLTVPITVLIMIRWGWYSAFFAVGDGLLLAVINNTKVWQSYVSFAIGNAAILLLLILIKFVGKKAITRKWYFSALFTVAAWVLMCTGQTLVQTILGYDFLAVAAGNFGVGITGLFSLVMAVVLVLVFRRFDGMFEDQVEYLKRTDKERKDKMRRDEFGDEPIEIDEETISILQKKDDDLY